MNFEKSMAVLSRQSTHNMLKQSEHLVELIRGGTDVARQSHRRCEKDAASRRAYHEAGQTFWLNQARRIL